MINNYRGAVMIVLNTLSVIETDICRRIEAIWHLKLGNMTTNVGEYDKMRTVPHIFRYTLGVAGNC